MPAAAVAVVGEGVSRRALVGIISDLHYRQVSLIQYLEISGSGKFRHPLAILPIAMGESDRGAVSGKSRIAAEALMKDAG